MVNIRPARPEDAPAIKDVINAAAYEIFGFDGTLEESLEHFENQGTYRDLEDIPASYTANGGLLLVAEEDGQVIGSGGVRRLEAHTAELRRMWLLQRYQGRGIGRHLLGELMRFARRQGYARVRLQTAPQQARALAFYRKAGFYEIPAYNQETGEVSMEYDLRPPAG